MIFEIARHSVENSFINELGAFTLFFVVIGCAALLWSVLIFVNPHKNAEELYPSFIMIIFSFAFVIFSANMISDVKNKESKTYYYSLTMKYNNQKSVTCIEEDKYKLLKKTELTQDNIEKIIGKDIDDIFEENTCPTKGIFFD